MWEKENGVEAGLPGHSYSPKQLFWIAAAQVILQVILNDINTYIHYFFNSTKMWQLIVVKNKPCVHGQQIHFAA